MQAVRHRLVSTPHLGGDAARRHVAGLRSRNDANMVDVATFLGDDCDALVSAALACPVCLGGEVEWSLEGDPYDPSADCSCRQCGYGRRVFLSGEQALRLAIAPVAPG